MVVNILDIGNLNKSQTFSDGGDLSLGNASLVFFIGGQQIAEMNGQDLFLISSAEDLGKFLVLSLDDVEVDAAAVEDGEENVEVTVDSNLLDQRRLGEFINLK